ncbi:ACT domain-containing protein [Candidatus Poribacteria bacterium]|nr:ACT domain-containing protein [Candidatus Poribacteria bacterium]
MTVKQISIFLENKSGRLAEVTKILADNNINIRALSLADTADFGILRVIVSDFHKASDVLKTAGYTLSETDVVAVEVPDKPGGLAGILAPLKEAEMDVEYMYAFVQSSGQNAIMIFRFEDPNKAIEILKGSNLKILSGEEVYRI